MNYAPEPTADQLESLAAVLAPGGSVRLAYRISGGLGCTMDVLAVTERGGAAFMIVLRRRTEWSQGNTDVAAMSEFKVLQHLQRHGIPAPEPIWFDQAEVFVEPSMLMSFVEGGALVTPDDPLDYAEQFALALVRLHDVPVDSDLAGLLTDLNEHERRFVAAEGPPERMAAHPLGAKLWAAQKAELERVDLAAPVLVHTDYWPGNTLWRDQRLVAIVDMEEAGVADPAVDVGTAVINLKFEKWGEEGAERFVEVYRGETGLSLDSLRYWMMRELRKPMPDIAEWLPSFQEMSSQTEITAAHLREWHNGLVGEVLK